VYADPERLAQFARAMSGRSAHAGRAIAAKFPWRDHGSVIDIGCAMAATSDQSLSNEGRALSFTTATATK
jgi:hypothetical protein